MEYYYNNLPILAGSLFNGVEINVDNALVVATGGGIEIKKLNSELTDEEKQDVLNIVKVYHIQNSIDVSFDEVKAIGFEYPVSSGNTFSIVDTSIYNTLNSFKTSLSYPMEFEGNGLSAVVFASSSDVDLFIAAALVAHQTAYQGAYLTAIAAIKAVTIIGSGSLEQAITDVFAISY